MVNGVVRQLFVKVYITYISLVKHGYDCVDFTLINNKWLSLCPSQVAHTAGLIPVSVALSD